MELNELVTYLDAYLDLASFEDASVNGLQLQAVDAVAQLAVAVDASLDAIEGAADQGAQLLVVHHGLLWGGAAPLTGVLGRRVRTAFDRGVSLYAAHLPLDAHTEVGNNACLARILGLEGTAPFGRYRGRLLGVAGHLPAPPDLDTLQVTQTEAGEPRGRGQRRRR